MKTYRIRLLRLLLTVLIPLITGVIIYQLFSPAPRFFFRFVPVIPFHYPLYNWISFSLPDALWTFAFVSMIRIIFSEKGYWRTVFTIITLLAGPVLEILQGLHWIYGTYDIVDFLLQPVFGGLAIWCETFFSKEQEALKGRFRTAATIVGCTAFLLMEMANEPDDRRERQEMLEKGTQIISIINNTGNPVRIIEEGKLEVRFDSGTANVRVDYNSADTGNYYIFAFNEWGKYPGIIRNGVRKTLYEEIKKLQNDSKLSRFGFFVDEHLRIPEEQRTAFQFDSSKAITRAEIWLPANGYKYSTGIPEKNPKNKLADDDFPSYRIFFTNKEGKADSLQLRGRQFYPYLNTNGEFTIN